MCGLFLAAALAACGSTGQTTGGDVFSASEGRASTVRLLVQNMNFSEARLYTHSRGGRKSLGVVGGKQDAEFTFDWPVAQPLQLEIDMLAGPRCITRSMEVDPGDTLELQITTVFSEAAVCG